MSKIATKQDQLFNQIVKICEFINTKIDEGAMVITSDGDIQTNKFVIDYIEEPIRERVIYYKDVNIYYYLVGDINHVENVTENLKYALEQLSQYKFSPKISFKNIDITKFK